MLTFICIFSVYSVRLPPKLSNHPAIQSQDIGTRLKILCSVQQGDSPFTFDWHKNGQKFFTTMEDNHHHHKLIVNEYESELTITKLNENDSGNYTCLVRNSIGSDRQTTMVVVKGSII
ncbi:Ig domain containing protein [Euroglyphus maynei]|uniref:Ig domain containing protein n=1 Tax=Euroglyphus maynei TaxID=6958 RepID=A0A1Y3BRU4_EURMA|nr:Ig domain containing protein [Euroglyphus maynei]